MFRCDSEGEILFNRARREKMPDRDDDIKLKKREHKK